MSNLSDTNTQTAATTPAKKSPSWVSQLGSGIAQAGLSALTGGVGGIASGILGGLGSTLFGSIFGGKSDVDKQNEMNYRIWQEQMAHNEHMYNKQFSDNVKMWQMENAYNDPSAVRARWEKAGFNPYLMMQSSGVGTAGSVNSPAMQSSTPPTMQAESNPAYDGLLMMQGSSQYLGQIEQIANLKLDGDLKRLDMISRTLKNGLDEKLRPWLIEQQEQLVKDMWQAFDFRDEMNGLELQKIRQDVRMSQYSADEKEIIVKYLDRRQQQELINLGEVYANLVRQGALTEEQAKTEIAKQSDYIASIRLKNSQSDLNEQEYNINKPDEIQANIYATEVSESEGMLKAVVQNEIEAAFYGSGASLFNSRIDNNISGSISHWLDTKGLDFPNDVKIRYDYLNHRIKNNGDYYPSYRLPSKKELQSIFE